MISLVLLVFLELDLFLYLFLFFRFSSQHIAAVDAATEMDNNNIYARPTIIGKLFVRECAFFFLAYDCVFFLFFYNRTSVCYAIVICVSFVAIIPISFVTSPRQHNYRVQKPVWYEGVESSTHYLLSICLCVTSVIGVHYGIGIF